MCKVDQSMKRCIVMTERVGVGTTHAQRQTDREGDGVSRTREKEWRGGVRGK